MGGVIILGLDSHYSLKKNDDGGGGGGGGGGGSGVTLLL